MWPHAGSQVLLLVLQHSEQHGYEGEGEALSSTWSPSLGITVTLDGLFHLSQVETRVVLVQDRGKK